MAKAQGNIEKAAHAKYVHNEGFSIDAEKLKKINDLLQNRLRSINAPDDIILKVYRSDSTNYTTRDFTLLESEENSNFCRIERISLATEEKGSLNITLDLANDYGVYLRVEGPDRDTVIVLFSDLRRYLEIEISRPESLPRKLTKHQVFFYILWFMMMFSTVIMEFLPTPGNQYDKKHDLEVDEYRVEVDLWKREIENINSYNDSITNNYELAINKVLDNKQANYSNDNKLDFIYKYLSLNHKKGQEFKKLPERPEYPPWQPVPFFTNYLYFMGFSILILLGLHLLKYLVEKYTDSFVFLIGKEVSKQAKRVALRERIVWSVLIGFLVSVAASIIVTILIT